MIFFGVKTIGKYINNALREELAQEATVANFATVQIEGGREVMRQVEHYNLDVIISVGYRIKSGRGIQFRRWANAVLRSYLLQGYSVNRHLIALQGNIVRTATHRAIIIDAYVTALTLDILSVRGKGVEAVIYTAGVGKGMQRLMSGHDRLVATKSQPSRLWE